MEKKKNRIITYSMFSFAFIFSFLSRMIPLKKFYDTKEFFWNDYPMLTTNDAYYYASGAQKWLEHTLSYNHQVPEIFSTAIITIAAYITKYSPFSLELVTFYIPAVISSFIVIPIILIGRLFSLDIVGFFAALLTSITWGYYARTKIGYFDTDMFSVAILLFILYLLLAAVKKQSISFVLAASILISAYPYFYNSGRPILYFIVATYIVYVFIFCAKKKFSYPSVMLIVIGLFSSATQSLYLFAFALLFYALLKKEKINIVQLKKISVFLIIIFVIVSIKDFSFILTIIDFYADRNSTKQGLKFFQMSQTIRETEIVPFGVFAKQISGSIIGAIMAIAGYILLVRQDKEFLLTIPMVAIGLFSLLGGVRFAIYLVPIVAFSLFYLIHLFASNLRNREVYYMIVTLFFIVLAYPDIMHIKESGIKTVLSHNEAKALQELKYNTSEKDFVIAWWDYAYAIWYFSDKNTLIDGGHSGGKGGDNYIVSRILMGDSPVEAARLARLAVETHILDDQEEVAEIIFKEISDGNITAERYFQNMREGKITLPQGKRSIFLYLPYSMLEMLSSVRQFSNIDLSTGEMGDNPIIYVSKQYRIENDMIVINNKIKLSPNKMILELKGKAIQLGKYFTIGELQNGSIQVSQIIAHTPHKMSAINLVSRKIIIILDEKFLNSNFIQMLLFNKYDKKLFHLTVKNKEVKIYKLKI
jgi:dolichyl-diphosphooligosaccharide--protein glycosyltransferase/undecaprenyl-diphosphooligosaccharide--protein glycosyltransferase